MHQIMNMKKQKSLSIGSTGAYSIMCVTRYIFILYR